ncbi:MAG: AraC family transcriptional regulator [Candidatus Eisenbacteria bacterium]|uniref:AraC family transcriptional regulator n=1 Tax=Eiseniibacteriota bacterium TaxID=2212470 RepID=A0A948RYC0_UNCEI|nr:AraC family transcriptional regulator [Candidatus Eisenbacteria bacterium]MBU2693273.1 AraC family transcriptional regulator [Candidatus Eisenbacteria bacterium]
MGGLDNGGDSKNGDTNAVNHLDGADHQTDRERKRLRGEYVSRINRVIDYIERNLSGDLSLETLAGVACFSRFHFHRIFSAMMSETLNQFIQRIRVERAAMMLDANPQKTITEIALDCGFSGSAAFARVFKEKFNMSASEWRNADPASKIRKTKSKGREAIGKIRKDDHGSILHIESDRLTQKWRMEMNNMTDAQVEVKEMPELHVAYVRHVGPYAGDAKLFEGLFNKLMSWAGPRGLLRFPGTQVICVYHDDPKITEEDKLRTSACITVPKGTPVDGEIGEMDIPGGQFAVARFELSSNEYAAAWNAVMGGWLPESGYQPDDRLCYEQYLNDPKTHPEGKCIVNICIPVRPL